MKGVTKKFKGLKEMKSFLKDIAKRNALAIKQLDVAILKDEKRLSEVATLTSEPNVIYKTRKRI